MTRNQKWQKHWQTPQLPSVRLGVSYAWILGALDEQPEGRAAAVRVLLREMLKKSAVKRLDARHMPKGEGSSAIIPPTRLVPGYEDLPETIAEARDATAKRVGYPLDNADIIRSALWDGLASRGWCAPPKPVNIYAEVLKHQGKPKGEIAAAIGVEASEVMAAMRYMKLLGEPWRPLTGAELRVALSKTLTQAEAAERLGVSQKTIAKARTEAGYAFDHRSDRLTDKQLAIALDTKLSYAEAAKRAKVSATTVHRQRLHAGLVQARKRKK